MILTQQDINTKNNTYFSPSVLRALDNAENRQSFTSRVLKEKINNKNLNFFRKNEFLNSIGIDSKNFSRFSRETMNYIKSYDHPTHSMHYGMDSLTDAQISASPITPDQFLQYWAPGIIYYLTRVLTIDKLVGFTQAAKWHDSKVVFTELELDSNVTTYSDFGNIPLSDLQTQIYFRQIVRFEHGLEVGILEEQVASEFRINTAEAKRKAIIKALEIIRNFVGFYGFNVGLGNTYGILNDPDLPAYYNLPNGVSGHTQWSTKTFQEIQYDITLMANTVFTQSGGHVNVRETPCILGVSQTAYQYLSSKMTDYGITVLQWMKENFPRLRVEFAPEFNGAYLSEDIAYLYAESVSDEYSTDNLRVFDQYVPAKLFALGIEKKSKSFLEDYSNATAGVVLKRPTAVTRVYGV